MIDEPKRNTATQSKGNRANLRHAQTKAKHPLPLTHQDGLQRVSRQPERDTAIEQQGQPMDV